MLQHPPRSPPKNNNPMKKFMLLATIMAFCMLGAAAQNAGGYVITHLATYNQAKLTQALDKCRFDNYRKQDQRVVLTFEDGSTVELLSVNEMQFLGYACDTKIVTPANHKQQNIFILHPDGYVMEEVRKDKNSDDRKLEMIEDAKKAKK